MSLRDLLLADPTQKVAEIMTANVIAVPPEMDQEEVAQAGSRSTTSTAIPVVDASGTLLGVITVDDVIDVLTQEQTEDVQRLAGVEPLEASYFQTTFWTFIRKRATWLVILFVEEFFTGSALRHYDTVIQAVAKLSYYVPLLISTGGNSGSQSASLIIRGLAVGEVKTERLVAHRGSRARPGARARAHPRGGRHRARHDVGRRAALRARRRRRRWWASSSWGAWSARCCPLALRRVGFDPATSSTPFIASLVDVLGIIIYFNIAQLILFEVIQSAVTNHP